MLRASTRKNIITFLFTFLTAAAGPGLCIRAPSAEPAASGGEQAPCSGLRVTPPGAGLCSGQRPPGPSASHSRQAALRSAPLRCQSPPRPPPRPAPPPSPPRRRLLLPRRRSASSQSGLRPAPGCGACAERRRRAGRGEQRGGAAETEPAVSHELTGPAPVPVPLRATKARHLLRPPRDGAGRDGAAMGP